MSEAPSVIDRVADIVAFVRVGELRNLSAAARELDMSPSTVSKVVTRLEKTLGVKLLNRTSRALSLTEEGKRFFGECNRILDAINSAEASVSNSEAPVGVLKVQSVPAFVRSQLAAAIPSFLRQYPGIRLNLHLSTEQTDLVRSGIDVAIHSGWLPDSNLIRRKISSSRWRVCASPDYLAGRGVPAQPSDLLAHDCLVQPASTPWHEWLFRIDGEIVSVPLNALVVCNQADALIEMAAAGLGLIRVAEFACSEAIASGRLVPVLDDFADPNGQLLVAIYQDKSYLAPRVSVFLDFLQSRFGMQPWRSS